MLFTIIKVFELLIIDQVEFTSFLFNLLFIIFLRSYNHQKALKINFQFELEEKSLFSQEVCFNVIAALPK